MPIGKYLDRGGRVSFQGLGLEGLTCYFLKIDHS